MKPQPWKSLQLLAVSQCITGLQVQLSFLNKRCSMLEAFIYISLIAYVWQQDDISPAGRAKRLHFFLWLNTGFQHWSVLSHRPYADGKQCNCLAKATCGCLVSLGNRHRTFSAMQRAEIFVQLLN